MKAWSTVLKANPQLVLRRASATAAKLPKYPLPPLQETLDKFLKSARPFLSTEEYAQSECLVKSFTCGEGVKLQELLQERANAKDNWLADWWLSAAYMEFRAPVVFWSSPGLLFPKQNFCSTDDMLMCAAKIINATLEYKKMIDDGAIPQEKMGKDPLDMSQYEKVLGTCRIPKLPSDFIVLYPKSSHIIVMYKNNPYKVVVKSANGWLKTNDLFKQLKKVTADCEPAGPPVGILTTDNRDNWARAYQALKQECANIPTLKEIEESLFLMCLDDKDPEKCANSDLTKNGMQCVYGGGVSANAANRWYDKTIQFIVNKDGNIGLTYEHSPAEGQPIAILMDFIVKKLEESAPDCPGQCEDPVRLHFKVSVDVQCAIDTAKKNLNDLVKDMELNVFKYPDYGKDVIKQFKVSPDSFIQMAIQLAFYRIHKVPGAHYESAATRKFIDGRTETIRSCSVESIAFAKMFLDSCAPIRDKANALRTAIKAHKDYTIQALNAHGVDRHLLGLKRIALKNDLPIPRLYSDPAFTRSSTMRISTSQVASKCDGVMVYGPITNDGYACCYNPRDKDINFGTSVLASCPETSTDKFQEALSASLCEMRDVLTKSPQAKL